MTISAIAKESDHMRWNNLQTKNENMVERLVHLEAYLLINSNLSSRVLLFQCPFYLFYLSYKKPIHLCIKRCITFAARHRESSVHSFTSYTCRVEE